jgi:hypothetical protein
LFRFHENSEENGKRKEGKNKIKKLTWAGPVRLATRAGRIRSRNERELGIPARAWHELNILT